MALCEETLSLNTSLLFALFLKQRYEKAWNIMPDSCRVVYKWSFFGA